MRYSAFFLAACLLFSGCASERKLRTADIHYYSAQEPATDSASAALARIAHLDDLAGTCIRVVDERRRTVVQGWSLPREQIRDWLVRGIESRLGIEVQYLDEPPSSGSYLALETLYIKHIADTMAGVTVLRAHGTETSRAVRGNRTRLNWNGTSREFSRLLSQSLDAAIAALPLPPLIQENCVSVEHSVDLR